MKSSVIILVALAAYVGYRIYTKKPVMNSRVMGPPTPSEFDARIATYTSQASPVEAPALGVVDPYDYHFMSYKMSANNEPAYGVT
jgi:hypothetical protein